MTHRLERKEQPGQANAWLLTLEGAATAAEGESLKKVLLEALDKADHLTLDVAALETVDLSFLQMLCALHRSAQKRKKQVRMAPGRSRAFQELAGQVGFQRGVSCDDSKDGFCFWTEGPAA